MTKNTDINKADFDYSAFKKKAIKDLYLGKELTGKNGVFGGMVKDILEAALSEELNQHLLGLSQNPTSSKFLSKKYKLTKSQ